ncbi:copper ABC transporter substrate-binding protein [Haloferula helveola]|uniref:Copper ABC transporter substrate-binding protein n=1 Tax=Haloferula helveola TaxID=490095 RepID=A0ABN6H614_9BACT|nr:copper ABC transporter substrate-binding protein [Haloferula helveola]
MFSAILACATAADVQVPGDHPTIQAAIDAAVAGDRVLVAPGSYSGDIDFNGKAVELASVAGPELTIINVGAQFDIGGGASLIGFTVRGTRPAVGGAITVNGPPGVSGPYIAGNIFEQNASQVMQVGCSINVLFASPVIEGNIFRNGGNSTRPNIAMVSAWGRSSPLITNNVFHDNEAFAVFLRGIAPAELPVVVNNTMVRGIGGIVVESINEEGQRVLRNNLITNNEVGLRLTRTFPIGTWENNLLFGNTVAYEGVADPTGTNGNISADPQFLDASNNNFRLPRNSPAVDAGTNMSAPLFDFDGKPRPIDGDGDTVALTDIGAFEADTGAGIGLFVEGGLEQECNTHGGALVSLSVKTTPEDLELISLEIAIDGDVVATGAPTQVRVPLGIHELSVRGVTADDGVVEDSVNMVITDTMPPVIEAWFEDRKTGERIETIASRKLSRVVVRVKADDLCDPNPEVDSVLGTTVADGQELRIQGGNSDVSLQTDTLTLKVSATDHSGNSSNLVKELKIDPDPKPQPRGPRLLRDLLSSGSR